MNSNKVENFKFDNVKLKNTNYNNYNNNKNSIVERIPVSNVFNSKNNYIEPKCINKKSGIKSISDSSGSLNPKTFIPPILAPRITDTNFWYNIETQNNSQIRPNNLRTLNGYMINNPELTNNTNIEPENKIPSNKCYQEYNIPDINRSNIDFLLNRNSNNINTDNIIEFAENSYLELDLQRRKDIEKIIKLDIEKDLPLWAIGPV